MAADISSDWTECGESADGRGGGGHTLCSTETWLETHLVFKEVTDAGSSGTNIDICIDLIDDDSK